MALCEIAINPIGDVKGTIQSQSEKIMRCYGVRLPSALKHEKLGQNSHGLEPYRERPKNLERSDEV